jgi:DNA-binding MarR family transcriptional regulator
MHKTGLREMVSDRDAVPIEVATLGNPYIAAYLYSVHEYEIGEIAEKLDLSEQSVSQYLTDVGKSRR